MDGNTINNSSNQAPMQENPEVKPVEAKIEPKPEKKKTDYFGFFKKCWFGLLIAVFLITIVIINIIIRTPNVPQLIDSTTGNYTLGPDLDPFLYLRLAKDIVAGTLQNPDMMVQAPLGSTSYAVKSMMPGAIVFVYRILDIFAKPPVATVEYAAVIAPVIFFSLSIIALFFFIYVLCSFKMQKKFSAIVAILSCLLYMVMPEMLHRTVAGIPEIESLGMLWFWLSFLFLTLAWKQNKAKTMIPMALLAGLFTGLMIYTWGGFRYIFMSVSLASFLITFFNKEKNKNFLIFSCWIIPALIFSVTKIGALATLTTISDTGFGCIIFFILIVDLILFNTKLCKIKEKIKLPEGLISLIVAILLGVVLLLLISPGFISSAFSQVTGRLLHPFGTGRIGLTVAENNSPYAIQAISSFSWLFWMFLVGVILLFFEAIKHFDTKKRIWLMVIFMFFLAAFIFSRISPTSFLNGDNFISNLLYFGSLALFVIFIFGMYLRAYYKKDDKTLEDFKKIEFSYLLIIALSFWMIVSMRGAIRLFFIISPVVAIVSAYLPVKIVEYALSTKDKIYKVLLFCIALLITVLLVLTFFNFEKSTYQHAKYTVNGAYYVQWQQAMEWVRTDTPKGSIFAHWWDYGYWVQTLGERPTVTDGGHINNYWDHTTARYLMTAQHEQTALQLCKSYNVSYYLVDSTDIGKYSAFASIGSDKTGRDRLSWVSTFAMSDSQTQETKNETLYVYTGGTMLDQDIAWNNQFFPAQKAGIGAFIMTVEKDTQVIKGIDAVMVYKNQQYRIPIKYMWMDNMKRTLTNSENALPTMLYFIPTLSNYGVNRMGAAMYLSEKALNAEFIKLYLLNESETGNFELVHSEPSVYVKQLKDVYNISVGDFLIAGDFQAPIKIWKVNYPANITDYPEYRKTVYSGSFWGELDYLGT